MSPLVTSTVVNDCPEVISEVETLPVVIEIREVVSELLVIGEVVIEARPDVAAPLVSCPEPQELHYNVFITHYNGAVTA